MFWGYPVATVAMATLLNFEVLKFLLKSLIFSVTKILKHVNGYESLPESNCVLVLETK